MAFPPVIPTIFKDPSAVLEYGFDLSPPPTQLIKPWLAAGEAVTSLSVTADSGIVIDAYSFITNSSGVLTALQVAWLSGGVAGTSYLVHFTFTTNQGRTDTRSLLITVVAR